MNEQRKKLSKRRDKVALEQYRDEGYLAEAMVNYLMTLGWSPGDTEIVPWSQIESTFRLEDVNKSPAFFDLKKLGAFNGEYIRMLTVDELVEACDPWLPAEWDREKFAEIAPLHPTPPGHARRRRRRCRLLVRGRSGDRRGRLGPGLLGRLRGAVARPGHGFVRHDQLGLPPISSRRWSR